MDWCTHRDYGCLDHSQSSGVDRVLRYRVQRSNSITSISRSCDGARHAGDDGVTMVEGRYQVFALSFPFLFFSFSFFSFFFCSLCFLCISLRILIFESKGKKRIPDPLSAIAKAVSDSKARAVVLTCIAQRAFDRVAIGQYAVYQSVYYIIFLHVFSPRQPI